MNQIRLDESEIRVRFCPECDLKQTCIHEGSEGKLSPLCLDGIATVVLRSDAESRAGSVALIK